MVEGSHECLGRGLNFYFFRHLNVKPRVIQRFEPSAAPRKQEDSPTGTHGIERDGDCAFEYSFASCAATRTLPSFSARNCRW